MSGRARGGCGPAALRLARRKGGSGVWFRIPWFLSARIVARGLTAMRADTSNYRDLFLDNVPMMDARAPVEFAKGAFPGVVNLPLMTDEERELVGICYKQRGQQAAIELGHRLVGGAVKAARLDAWAAFAKAHPDGYLYCFRGGLRSQIVQQWLRDEAGIAYPRVTGGYKAMRGFLLDTLDRAIAECDFLVLGGMTGTGKTEVLRRLDDALDLEGHANHRGSSFGKRVSGQPTQINFDNALAIDILRNAPPDTRASWSRTRARPWAAAACRPRCTRACSAMAWCGWRTAWRIASSASCATT